MTAQDLPQRSGGGSSPEQRGEETLQPLVWHAAAGIKGWFCAVLL